MNAFTPGAWYAEDRGERHVVLSSGAGYEIASIDGGMAEAHAEVDAHEADASLIAAAPDLFGACALALATMKNGYGRVQPSELRGRLEAAIAKARGGAR
jgi:hypothetical protein